MLERFPNQGGATIRGGLREAADNRDAGSRCPSRPIGDRRYGKDCGVHIAASRVFAVDPIRLAGFPAQISKGGTFDVTMEAAPTTAPRPMVTPLRMVAC